jgi:hypothetical protein
MTEANARPGAGALRTAVIALAGIEMVVFGGLELLFLSQALTSNEQLGRSIGWALAAAIALPMLLLALPALILGVMGRWLKLALILAILAAAIPVTIRIFS